MSTFMWFRFALILVGWTWSTSSKAGSVQARDYEYSTDGLRIVLETTPQGTALFVLNESDVPVVIAPSLIEFKNVGKTFSACTISMQSLFGLTSPGEFTVPPGKRDAFIVQGEAVRRDGGIECERGSQPLVFSGAIAVTVGGRVLKYVGNAAPFSAPSPRKSAKEVPERIVPVPRGVASAATDK